jgi:hypothetical protein
VYRILLNTEREHRMLLNTDREFRILRHIEESTGCS